MDRDMLMARVALNPPRYNERGRLSRNTKIVDNEPLMHIDNENLSMKLGIISSAANSIADMTKSTRESTMRSDENQYTETVDMRTQFIAMEECAELIMEICKILSGESDDDIGLYEEMADVYIILQQLKIKYKINEEKLLKFINVKLERGIEALEGGNLC